MLKEYTKYGAYTHHITHLRLKSEGVHVWWVSMDLMVRAAMTQKSGNGKEGGRERGLYNVHALWMMMKASDWICHIYQSISPYVCKPFGDLLPLACAPGEVLLQMDNKRRPFSTVILILYRSIARKRGSDKCTFFKRPFKLLVPFFNVTLTYNMLSYGIIWFLPELLLQWGRYA